MYNQKDDFGKKDGDIEYKQQKKLITELDEQKKYTIPTIIRKNKTPKKTNQNPNKKNYINTLIHWGSSKPTDEKMDQKKIHKKEQHKQEKSNISENKTNNFIEEGDKLFNKKKYKEAEKYYEKVLKFYRDNSPKCKLNQVIAFKKLGDINRECGMIAKADEQYKKALTINPAYAPAWLGFAKTFTYSETSISNCTRIANLLMSYYNSQLAYAKNLSLMEYLCQSIIKLAKYRGTMSGGINMEIDSKHLRRCIVDRYIRLYPYNKTNQNKTKITKKDLMWIKIKSDSKRKTAILKVISALTRTVFGENQTKLTSDKHAEIYGNLYNEDYLKLCIAFPNNKKVNSIIFKHGLLNSIKILFKNEQLAKEGKTLLEDVSPDCDSGKLKGNNISYQILKNIEQLAKFLKALEQNYGIAPLCDYPEREPFILDLIGKKNTFT